MSDDWTRLRYAVVDVEGNGQQPPDLVEVGVIHIVDGVVGEPRSWLVKPPRPISYMASRIHGISTRDVANAPAFAEVADEILRALDADAVVAHNAHVDVGVLQRHLGDWECPEVFDTLKLAKRFLPGQVSYRLGALVEALGLAKNLSNELAAHRVTYDVIVAAQLFVRLAVGDNGQPRSLEQLRGQPLGTDGEEIIALF